MNNEVFIQQPTEELSTPPAKKPFNFKILIIVVVALIVLIGAGVGVYFFVIKPSAKTPEELIMPLPENVEPKELLPEEVTEKILPKEEEAPSEIPVPAEGEENLKDGPLPTAEENGEQTVIIPQVTSPIEENIDTDGDGLSDIKEAEIGTDPLSHDTDNDGLFDKEEYEFYGTNPLKTDTDGDGYGDGDEVRSGYNPLGEGTLQYNMHNQLKN